MAAEILRGMEQRLKDLVLFSLRKGKLKEDMIVFYKYTAGEKEDQEGKPLGGEIRAI